MVAFFFFFIPKISNAQYNQEFVEWCEANPDTTGYYYIVSVDSSTFHTFRVLEKKIRVLYGRHNFGYDMIHLWYWYNAKEKHLNAISGKRIVIDTFLYAKPIVKDRMPDLINYKEFIGL